jgi:glycerol dehydrogenase
VYDENQQLIAVEHLPRSPAAVIVDTVLLATAPRDLLRAGIGDALSKKFEAEQCFASGGSNMFGAAPTLAAQLLADGAFRVLRADAEEALECAGSGVPTPAFERAVEAALLLGGLGFESGGLSIAHALTRGWASVPGVATQRHGLLVAFGLLIQLALEKRTDGMLQVLIDWYPRLGLPRTLADLGGADAPEATLRAAAYQTLAAPHARNFKRAIGVEELVSCLVAFRERAEVF